MKSVFYLLFYLVKRISCGCLMFAYKEELPSILQGNEII